MRYKLSGKEKIIALLETVRFYNVYTNPEAAAIYEMELTPSAWWQHHRRPRSEWSQLPYTSFIGFSIHCTPTDYPEDELWVKLNDNGYWATQEKIATAFRRKPSTCLAESHWIVSETDEDIVALGIRTNAYQLGLSQAQRHNRIHDITWAINKISFVWKHALPNIALPRISVIAPDKIDEEHLDLYDFVSDL